MSALLPEGFLIRLRRDEAGTMTLWMVGLALLVLAVGGISVDLWRAVAERRGLAAVADAAAFAGASGLDETAFRTSGSVQLDPDLAAALARRRLALDLPNHPTATAWRIAPDVSGVQVTVEGRLDLGLLGLLAPQHDPLPLSVTARAAPRVVP